MAWRWLDAGYTADSGLLVLGGDLCKLLKFLFGIIPSLTGFFVSNGGRLLP
jgi:hypothetical protein